MRQHENRNSCLAVKLPMSMRPIDSKFTSDVVDWHETPCRIAFVPGEAKFNVAGEMHVLHGIGISQAEHIQRMLKSAYEYGRREGASIKNEMPELPLP